MLQASVEIEEIDIGYDDLITRLSDMGGRFADAGYMDETIHVASGKSLTDIAIWNNYGTLNEDNTWHIPPRRFMEASLTRRGIGSISKEVSDALDNIYDGGDAESAIETIAKAMSVSISVAIEIFNRPVNAESTVDQKGFDDPLIETGELQNNVQHKTGRE